MMMDEGDRSVDWMMDWLLTVDIGYWQVDRILGGIKILGRKLLVEACLCPIMLFPLFVV
jgi:hypothetical protein